MPAGARPDDRAPWGVENSAERRSTADNPALARLPASLGTHCRPKLVHSGTRALTILHALVYTIPSGQFVAVVGPSGSGKSTLLGLLAGLDAPTTGAILLAGRDLTRVAEG